MAKGRRRAWRTPCAHGSFPYPGNKPSPRFIWFRVAFFQCTHVERCLRERERTTEISAASEKQTTKSRNIDVRYPFRRPSEQAKKASYGGGRVGDDDGMLSRNDVLRSLADLGIHVDGWEADALLDRFAVEDGSNNVRIASRRVPAEAVVTTEPCTLCNEPVRRHAQYCRRLCGCAYLRTVCSVFGRELAFCFV